MSSVIGSGGSSIRAFLFALSVAVASPAFAQTQVVPDDRVVRTVNVREGPGTDTLMIASLRPGEVLEQTGEVPNWYQVRLPDGRQGFVSKAWTLPLDGVEGIYRVHAIDVGTGLAVFVEGPDFTLLYDAGSNDDSRTGANNRVLAYLAKIRPGLATIDHVVLSHAHKDHLQLLPDIFDRFHVRHLWDSGRLYDSCGYRRLLLRAAAEPGLEYHTGMGGPGEQRFEFANCRTQPAAVTLIRGAEMIRGSVPLGAGATMSILYVDTAPHADPNENSVVVRLDLGGRRILLPGDAEAGRRAPPEEAPQPGSIEAELLACCRDALAADVLVAGHHGSMTSSRSAFLDAVGARTFIVSSGPYSYSGTSLPDAEVIAQFRSRGTVWSTLDNDVACAINPGKIGNDADGKPGGCDNIQIDITADGMLRTRYARIAD